MADRLGTPWFIPSTVPSREARAFYERHAHKALIVGLSRSSRLGTSGLVDALVYPESDRPGTVAIGLPQERLPPVDRPNGSGQGTSSRHRGRRSQWTPARPRRAGPARPGGLLRAKRWRLGIDGDRVCYVGDVSGRTKVELFAHAAALLMPIRWEEPLAWS